MKKKTIVGLMAVVAIVAVVMFAGCIEHTTETTRIRDIHDHPEEYNGEKVTVEGYVEDVVASLGFGITDEAGDTLNIIYVEYDGNLPTVGNKVMVTGVIRTKTAHGEEGIITAIFFSGESWEYI